MLEHGKIDSKQAILLMISMILPTAILIVPAITLKYAKQDAWLSLILATLVGLLIAWLVVSLSLRFPGKTIIEYTEEILGRVLGKIVGFLYIYTFMRIGSGVCREFGFFLVTAMMPETPMIVFIIIAIVISAYAVRNGLEVLCRFNQLFIPVTGLLVIAFLLSTTNMKLTRLLPVFDTGLLSIAQGAVSPIAWLGEILTLAMIIPYLTKPKEAYRVAVISVLLSGFILMINTMESLLIFGPDLANHWLYPTYNAVRVVSIANFLERLDAVILMVWILGGFIKIGVFYYAFVLGSAQWMGLKDYRPLVLPAGLIMGASSYFLFGINIVEYYSHLPYHLILPEVVIPLLLLIVALAKGKGKKSEDEAT